MLTIITNRILLNFICLLVFLMFCAAHSDTQKNSECNKSIFGDANALAAIFKTFNSMDPHCFDSININVPNLHLTLVNVTLKGMKTCQFTHFSLELPRMIGGVRCNLNFDGGFNGNGNLLSKPFDGTGEVQIILNNFEIYGDVDIVTVKEDICRQYWQISKPRAHYKLPENHRTKIVFRDHKDGDITKGVDPAKIFKEIGGPVVDAIVMHGAKTVNTLLKF